ncbi:MAG: BA14K family protein [Syntrophorhabdaceae bacterium]|nr:BA14K family protein [Syntrophorhabdaceae bacterium]
MSYWISFCANRYRSYRTLRGTG